MRTLEVMTATDVRLGWQPPGGAYLDGAWVQGAGDLLVTDPEDGGYLASVHDSTPGDVRQAVTSLSREFDRGVDTWPLWRRREAMYAASTIVHDDRERLARIIAAEGSKTLREATREVGRATETLRLTAELADRLNGETLPMSNTPRAEGRIGWFTREPIGIVAAITPFNDPLNLVVHKVAPALLAGNVVALKPAEMTPLSSLAFAEILLRAGVPVERFAVLPGTGPRAGHALVSDSRIDLVSFTGGHRTGDAVARAAGAKKMLMELGGNCAVIVLADADLNAAADGIVDGAFGVAGQNCVSVQRVFVADSVADEVIEKVVRLTGLLNIGSKQSLQTDVGPMIDEAAAQGVEELVLDACRHGAAVRTGGHRSGTFVQPTVLTDVGPSARIMSEEAFGPVVCIAAFSSLDHAISQVNNTDYGLHAGVFTSAIDSALDVARRLRVGGVMINDTSDFRIDAMPFGGAKRSGIGREGVRNTLEAMTEPKVVIVKPRAIVT
jgi:glyceraldehyde-3-phosphate dehydrogenase (NADP+)